MTATDCRTIKMYQTNGMPTWLAAFVATCTMVAPTQLAASCESSARLPADISSLTAKITELQAQVANLKDRQQIHEVYLHYMRGFDRNDVGLLRSAFWPDAQINYGPQSNTVDQFITNHLQRHMDQLRSWGHLVTNESMDIDGEVAHVEAYVTALWVPNSKESFAYQTRIVSGRYIDRLERRGGEWRISVREFVAHFFLNQANPDLPIKQTSPPDCAMGTWDKSDPSYLRPLTRRTEKMTGPRCAPLTEP